MTAPPPLLGYVDPMTVAPGDEVALHVSALVDAFEVDVVRLARLDAAPEVISTLGEHAGRVQELTSGSYLRVPSDPALDAGSFTFSAWIKPTLPQLGRPQAIASHGDRWGIGLDGEARLTLWAGGAAAVRLSPALPSHRWTHVTVAVAGDQATMSQEPVPEWPVGSWRASGSGTLAPGTGGDLLIGARAPGVAHFNGVIDRPTLTSGDETIAAWRSAYEAPDTTVLDIGPHGLHAQAVNFPARGVPGANWSGREVDFRLARDEFDALHFHDDDLTDARWEPTLRWRVPDDLRSGIHAFRLRAGEAEQTIAFYVRPREATARAAFLVPTMTYLAYANIHATPGYEDVPLPREKMRAEHLWATDHSLASLYDVHRDGSGAYYTSHRKPLTNITPDHVDPNVDSLWNLSADLSLVDWLEHEGFDYDVITDEDLHREGLALLARYAVIVTGTHPEYYTAPMLDAHEAYLEQGGRVMYLGGNGFYWVTGVSEAEPHVIEIRRGHAGTRTWDGVAGESVLSTTGEVGGLWRHRGRPPQRHLGVGFASQGFGQGRPYDVAGAGADGRGAFALEGVGATIDAEGLVCAAPAGAEIDRADDALDTPPHAVVLASATAFSDDYQHAIEEVWAANSRQGGSVEPRVRADVVFFETPNGGAVLSTGSIAWSTCLAADDYDNAVARVTGNVLRRFLDPTPL